MNSAHGALVTVRPNEQKPVGNSDGIKKERVLAA